jgi:SAM-dependent methyltransferase
MIRNPTDAYQLDLDPATPITKSSPDGQAVQCLPAETGKDDRVSLPLDPGESFETPVLHPDPGAVLAVGFELPGSNPGSIDIDWSGRSSDGATWAPLARLDLPTDTERFVAELSLPAAPGTPIRIRVTRSPSPGSPARLSLLRVAPAHTAGRANALASYAHRLRNEIGHFSNAYSHAMYGEQPKATESSVPDAESSGQHRDTDDFQESMRQRIEAHLDAIAPLPGEVAFTFASRALGSLLPVQPPDFFARARRLKDRGRPLRVLSILAGAGRVEEALLEHFGDDITLTLLDATPALIEQAAARMEKTHPGAKVECLVGDINAGLPGSGRFDVIVCVSALHHVADLEGVLASINARLEDDGEFWSIGEQIGRNGNRLWPEALDAANVAFSRLPSHLRRNANTCQVDDAISDRDFSANSFEGIRSEELEALLEAYLLPEHVYKRNAFLWRLVDATYGDNFTLSDSGDLAHLKQLVTAEALHWVSGGRSTELHGVYRRKRITAP